MDLLLFIAAVCFAIGALRQYLGRFGAFLDWLCAGLCFATLSFIFAVKV